MTNGMTMTLFTSKFGCFISVAVYSGLAATVQVLVHFLVFSLNILRLYQSMRLLCVCNGMVPDVLLITDSQSVVFQQVICAQRRKGDVVDFIDQDVFIGNSIGITK